MSPQHEQQKYTFSCMYTPHASVPSKILNIVPTLAVVSLLLNIDFLLKKSYLEILSDADAANSVWKIRARQLHLTV